MRAWLSLGSNIDRKQHLTGAVAALRSAFGDLVISPVYESEAVGFDGESFFNLVLGIDTDQPIDRLIRQFHAIEEEHGRIRGDKRLSSRALDIDLLTYGDRVSGEGGYVLPREEILHYAFVLCPLADVAGWELHPVNGKSYHRLWTEFDQTAQGLVRVGLTFD